jgi:hypothetical protein
MLHDSISLENPIDPIANTRMEVNGEKVPVSGEIEDTHLLR